MEEQRKSSIKWIIVGVVIGIVVLASSIFAYNALKQPSAPETNQLTIASFESEVKGDDPAILAYMDLEIDDYWVEGNNVRSSGTVKWHTTEYTIEGMSVCMFITRNQTNSVNVEVVVYGGGLLLPTGTIDSDSVQIPKLGEQVFSFDFSLTCTCQ